MGNLKIKSKIKQLKRQMKYLYLKSLPKKRYESFLKHEYKKRTGVELHLDPPKKYTEKVQYSKLYNNTLLKTKLSDKYLVREWISGKIGEEYLIPLIGAWDNFSDIPLEKLPQRFVLKTNHGAGWNEIVEDKNTHDFDKSQSNFDKWLKKNFAFNGDLQLHYKDISPKVVAEKFIQDSEGELKEYKFFCFDGKPYYCWFILETEDQRYGNIYDLDWNIQPWIFEGRENTPQAVEKPQNYEKMIDIATKLSKGFSHVRVDLYNVDGEIYFGEMTFTSAGGYRLIIPEKYNYMLGDLWNLDYKSDSSI